MSLRRDHFFLFWVFFFLFFYVGWQPPSTMSQYRHMEACQLRRWGTNLWSRWGKGKRWLSHTCALGTGHTLVTYSKGRMKPPVKPDGQCWSCWTWIRCLRVCSHTVMTVSFERSLSGVEITTVIPSCSITTACIQRAGRTWSRTDSAEAAELAHSLNSMPACVLTHRDDREFWAITKWCRNHYIPVVPLSIRPVIHANRHPGNSEVAGCTPSLYPATMGRK